MNGPKPGPSLRVDAKVGADPLHQLPHEDHLLGARATGDKFALLEELLLEGKLSRTPYAGPQALLTEVPLSSSELVSNAVSGTRSAGSQVTNTMAVGQKTDLLNRVLKDRPYLSIRELKATCEMLEINPRPFIDRLVQHKTDRLIEAVQQANQQRTAKNVVLALRYQSREDLGAILEKFEEKQGRTVGQSMRRVLASPHERISLGIALMGAPETAREDLMMVQGTLSFHLAERQRHRFLMPRLSIRLASAAEKLRNATLYLNGDDLMEEETYDAFKTLLLNAENDIANYDSQRSLWEKDPWGFISLLIAGLAAISIIYIGSTENHIVILTLLALSTCMLWWHQHLKANESASNILTTLGARYLTESQRRAHLRSVSLKKLIS